MGRYNKTTLLGLLIIMSLLNLLLGCKKASVKGPDFSSAMLKVLHLSTGNSFEYEMPGNMTKEFNYGERYKKESEITIKIDVSDKSKYEKDTWQQSYYLDGASWDYEAGKSQGVNGELGRLNVVVSVGHYKGDIEPFISKAYDSYLNGENGPNANARDFGVREGLSEERVSRMLISGPRSFEHRTINDIDYLYWVMEKEFSARTFTYFIHVLDEQHYLAFRFYHYFSAKSESELKEMKEVVQSDINRFMDCVSKN